MAPAPAPKPVTEPFPISCIAGRYLLFDVDVIAHCRRAHNICGLLIGTIPNLSQQNVFLGIPLELMPEEARVLVENGAAFVVDDVEVHRKGFGEMSREQRLKYLEEMDRRGTDVARDQQDKAERRKDKALKERGLKRETVEKRKEGTVLESSTPVETLQPEEAITDFDLGLIMKGSSFSTQPTKEKLAKLEKALAETTLFDPTSASPAPSVSTAKSQALSVQKHFVTPTTSYPPLSNPSPDDARPLPVVPKSYSLFRYLHSKGYFHMPGLRFGCHYNVYPGDPLRYHSHFAATGLGWDEEFDLLDIVGGGRLGTGTKKAYMVGGEAPSVDGHGEGLLYGAKGKANGAVRAFSVEWAAL